VVVHVPTPRIEDTNTARRLQRAAAAGVRLWNGQPFPILVDERGTREAHFRVIWLSGLSGNQIGVARTRWSKDSGLSVESIQLATRSPFDGSRVIEPRQIRLTAAHEMGHALGLPHSNNPRDVMYSVNTANALTAQDYLTMEGLYALEDGTEIVR
jgi:predicted Zn-dependent protease